MVLREQHLSLVAIEVTADVAFREELFFHPQRASHAKRGEAARRHAQVRLEDALELEQRLVVKPDIRQVDRPDAGGRKTVGDRMRRECGIALLAREALFLRRRHDLAVREQACGAVVIKGRNAEDVLGCHGVAP